MIPFSCSCALLKIHSFQNGIFSEFVFDAENSFLNFARFFQFLCVCKEIVLMIFLRHHIVAGDIDPLDGEGGIYNPVIKGCDSRNDQDIGIGFIT